MSSSDPNLQNIPVRSEIGREIRQAFIAPPGKRLLSCDYSQVELRLLAHVTKDPTLTQAFQADEDIHKATAATVFNVPLEEVTSDQRRQAKTINFAVIYGQSGFALAATLGVGTGVATTWIKEYFERLPGVKKYIDDTAALAHRQKYVQTLSGRRRYVPELDSGNAQVRQAAERAAVNMPIQGTAADIMKIAMIGVQKYLKETCGAGCTLLLQVHDELLFEVEEDMVAIVTPEIKRIHGSRLPARRAPPRRRQKRSLLGRNDNCRIRCNCNMIHNARRDRKRLYAVGRGRDGNGFAAGCSGLRLYRLWGTDAA